MQSFLHNALVQDCGYFHVWISGVVGQPFFRVSADKAFFLTLLQDNLSPRMMLGELAGRRRHQEIELLAYSLTPAGVHLLVHTTRKQSIEELGQVLLLSYAAYIHADGAYGILPFDSIFMFDNLVGRHEALQVSREIHLLHEDWRNDRYSSIGFYLDDRRGDWMHPHRLTSLFDNKPRKYVQFLKSPETEPDRIFEYLEI